MLLNAFRTMSGVLPLQETPLLDTVAQQRCEQQKAQGFISHAGLPPSLGENLAAGYRNEKDVMAGWSLSQGHADNMKAPHYREVGLALCYGKPWGTYWTMVFGGGNRPLFRQGWFPEVAR